MKILVTGIRGQLGYDVLKELQCRNIICIGAGRTEFDITDSRRTRDFIMSYAPDAVIHCSAYTAVDKAEDDVETCIKVNVEGVRNIAVCCKEINAKMVYLSSDYIFNGKGDRPFEVTDTPDPLSVYGRSKLAGEEEIRKVLSRYFIVRISWVFGINGNNFIKTMMRLGKDRKEVNVVDDQVGSPTYTADLASLLCDMIETEKYGTYHATNEGYCSWADLAEKTFEIANMQVKVNHILTEKYPTRAARPENSRLSKISLDNNGFSRLPAWESAVERFVNELMREKHDKIFGDI
ncbi:dTDP-4-dehydrorhamnose reductase [Desulfitobacterium sp. Sab5]|uniref:dTDP-4-dehydrorhamnose reductase n=1 Tax=Desulfitobacterium nosdiversum TaxID=3375356 RepID=UPI003CF4ADE6